MCPPLVKVLRFFLVLISTVYIRSLLDNQESTEEGVRIRLGEWKTVVNTMKDDWYLRKEIVPFHQWDEGNILDWVIAWGKQWKWITAVWIF